jgi:hypothetical protein
VNLRDMAEGQSCIRCGTHDGTIVLCHYTGVRRPSFGGGLGIKAHDGAGAEMCGRCHREMDTLKRSKAHKWEHSEEFLFYVVLTWMRRMDEDKVKAGKV